MNPYDWKRHRPQFEVLRPEVAAVAEDLRQGGSGVLLAGRGMGKSVFLHQLRREIERDPQARALFFREPPPELTVRACLATLAERLEVDLDTVAGSSLTATAHDLVAAYLARDGAPSRLVLLYDEFDRYGKPGCGPAAEPPGRDFFNSLESMRRDLPQVGILAAGSIGVFVFRDALGSSFLARADKVRIGPFGRREIDELARPLAEQRQTLAGETLDALLLATGGNAALLTYGLGALWRSPAIGERRVTEVFVEFQHTNAEFLRDFELSFADPRLSAAPQQVWELIQKSDGEVSHSALAAACAGVDGILRLDFADVLDLLQAAGLVSVAGSVRANPVQVRPIVSILSLPTAPSPASRIRQRLREDLQSLLFRLHVSSADFFRPAPSGSDRGKRLVPEAVFSAYLALGLELLGWQTEREAQHVAGRTDLRLRWNGSREMAVIEVKIWGRGGYREVLRQVTSYWSADTVAGAVVMLSDAELGDWAAAYRRNCLGGPGVEVDAPAETPPPLAGLWGSTSKTADGVAVEVDHFLLRLPRGR